MKQETKRRMYDVVALGELLVDFAKNGTSEQGNTLFEACPGGAPCNVLAMLNKLGKKTAFIGKVGNDQFGAMLKETIQTAGIAAEGLQMDPDIHTTLAFVHTMPDGDREFSFYRNPGADMMLTEEEIDADLLQEARLFHFGTLSMTDEPIKSATKRALCLAKEAGCLISFDPNLREPLWKSLQDAKEAMEYGFGYCDILKISDNEIQFVTGKEDYEEGIRILQETYKIPLIFLTLGKEGSRAYYQDLRVEQPGVSVNTIEATGAGDTFLGSVLAGLLDHGFGCPNEAFDENSLNKILAFANAAAALITTRRGAIRSMPDREEVEALFKTVS